MAHVDVNVCESRGGFAKTLRVLDLNSPAKKSKRRCSKTFSAKNRINRKIGNHAARRARFHRADMRASC
jgi:hypothetical protein